MKTTAKFRCVFCTLMICLVLPLLVGDKCQPDGVNVQENFVVAYVTDQDQINVRWALVNSLTSWNDGAFPGTVQAGRGVGIVIDYAGMVHMALTDTPTAVRMVWGLGPSMWDNFAIATPSAPPDSSPVGVDLGQNRYAISFRRSGGTAFIGIYESSIPRHFLGDFAPQDQLNTQVEGRPSIAKSGNTVVVAWRRWNGTLYELVTARGTVNQGFLNFTRPQLVQTPSSSELAKGVIGDPVITRAGTNYILAVVRTESGGSSGGLHGWRTQLFSSVDGQVWSSIGITSILEVHNHTYLGLGGASTGSLLVAAFNKLSTGYAYVSAASFSNGQWQAFTSNQLAAIFNRPAVWKPFVIVRNKQ